MVAGIRPALGHPKRPFWCRVRRARPVRGRRHRRVGGHRRSIAHPLGAPWPGSRPRGFLGLSAPSAETPGTSVSGSSHRPGTADPTPKRWFGVGAPGGSRPRSFPPGFAGLASSARDTPKVDWGVVAADTPQRLVWESSPSRRLVSAGPRHPKGGFRCRRTGWIQARIHPTGGTIFGGDPPGVGSSVFAPAGHGGPETEKRVARARPGPALGVHFRNGGRGCPGARCGAGARCDAGARGIAPAPAMAPAPGLAAPSVPPACS